MRPVGRQAPFFQIAGEQDGRAGVGLDDLGPVGVAGRVEAKRATSSVRLGGVEPERFAQQGRPQAGAQPSAGRSRGAPQMTAALSPTSQPAQRLCRSVAAAREHLRSRLRKKAIGVPVEPPVWLANAGRAAGQSRATMSSPCSWMSRFSSGGRAAQVFQAANVAGVRPARSKRCAVERALRVGVVEQGAQAAQLQTARNSSAERYCVRSNSRW